MSLLLEPRLSRLQFFARSLSLLFILFLADFAIVSGHMLGPSVNEVQVAKLLKPLFPKVGVAAIMGNIDVETRGTFDYKTKQVGGGGYGLFQFDGVLKTKYDSWRAESKLQDSAESQIRFAKALLTTHSDVLGAGNVKKINDALKGYKLDKATEVFCNLFERPGVPHLDRRKAAAQRCFDNWKYY